MTYYFKTCDFYIHNLKRLHIYGRKCFAKSISLIIEIPVKVCRYRALIRLLTLSTSLPCRLFWFVDCFDLSTFLLCLLIYPVNLFTQSTLLLSRPFYSVDLITLSTFHSVDLCTLSTFIPCQLFYPVHLSLVTGSGQVRTTRTLLEETRSPVHLYIAVTDGLISVQTLLSVDILSRGNVWCFNTLSPLATLFFYWLIVS